MRRNADWINPRYMLSSAIEAATTTSANNQRMLGSSLVTNHLEPVVGDTIDG
ncbi:MAG: hypothetical protein R3B46_06335 [Phycisphaerales bacterium]